MTNQSTTEDNQLNDKKNKPTSTKRKKKILYIFIAIVLLLVILFVPSLFSKKLRLLYSREWNSDIGTLSIKPPFEFVFYNSGSGNPVGDSDLRHMCFSLGDSCFVTAGEIQLFKVGKILYIDEDQLLLNYDGDQIIFYNNDNPDNSNTGFLDLGDTKEDLRCDKCNRPLENKEMIAFSNGTGIKTKNKIFLCPWKVYGAKDRDKYDLPYILTSTAKCTYINYYSEIAANVPIEEEIHNHKCSVKKISQKKALDMLSTTAYQVAVNLNSNGDITELVIIEGDGKYVNN